MIIYQHDLKHSCMPYLAVALKEVPGMLYGSVTVCPTCKQAWMLTPRRLWLRRHIVNAPGFGFWVREPWTYRRDRRDSLQEALDFDLDDILIKAARRR